MQAQQDIFTRLKTQLEAKGYAVYDGQLPKAGTAYPFIYMGESMATTRPYKGALSDTVTQSVHVYHNNDRKRGTVSYILSDIKMTCFRLGYLCTDLTQDIMEDTTTDVPLVHGLINATFKA